MSGNIRSDGLSILDILRKLSNEKVVGPMGLMPVGY